MSGSLADVNRNDMTPVFKPNSRPMNLVAQLVGKCQESNIPERKLMRSIVIVNLGSAAQLGVARHNSGKLRP